MALKRLMSRSRSSRGGSKRNWLEPMQQLLEGAWPVGFERGWLNVSLEQTPKELVVKAKLPGMSREDLRIDVTENTLTLSGCKSISRESRRHGGLREESSQTFVQQFSLPAEIKTNEVTASFAGETLVIRLPRVKETEVRRIDIA